MTKTISEHIEDGTKDCPECFGEGYTAEHGCNGNDSICRSICPVQVPCETCNGTGSIPYTEEDVQNDKENEIISNAKMMSDD
jgi:hypothetical protein